MSRPATFYRCSTPTDWLCRCGTVARELRRQGIDYREIRTGLRRGLPERDEVAALTGQRRVPVLLLDGDAICDSRRIIEHLEWRKA